MFSSTKAQLNKPFIIGIITVVALLILASLFLLTDMFVGQALYQGAPNEYGLQGPETLTIGDIQTYEVRANVPNEISAYEFLFTFNPDVLNCESYVLADNTDGWDSSTDVVSDITCDNGAGIVRGERGSLVTQTGDMRLAVITFRAIGTGDVGNTPITWNYFRLYENGNEVTGLTTETNQIIAVEEGGEFSCVDNIDNDNNGQIDCADVQCNGETGPNGVTCCQADNDCSANEVCINNICQQTVCGNSVVEGIEECDDGNTDDGDGCSATCMNELEVVMREFNLTGPSSITVGDNESYDVLVDLGLDQGVSGYELRFTYNPVELSCEDIQLAMDGWNPDADVTADAICADGIVTISRSSSIPISTTDSEILTLANLTFLALAEAPLSPITFNCLDSVDPSQYPADYPYDSRTDQQRSFDFCIHVYDENNILIPNLQATTPLGVTIDQAVGCTVDADCTENQVCTDNICEDEVAVAEPQPEPTPTSSGGGGGRGGIGSRQQTTTITPPQCSDGIDNDDDGFIDYPDDKSCISATYDNESSPCREAWFCSKWSTCNNGIQTRTCNDERQCGTTLLKPTQQRSCAEPQPTPTPQPTERVQPPPPTPAPIVQEPSFLSRNLWWIILIAVLIILAVAGVLFYLYYTKAHLRSPYEEARDWVRKERREGVNDAELRQLLAQEGWQNSDIIKVFQMTDNPAPLPNTPEPNMRAWVTRRKAAQFTDKELRKELLQKDWKKEDVKRVGL